MRRLAAALLGLVAACAPHGDRGPDRPAEVPADAIPAGENLWMVPLAEKVDGCPAFRSLSPGRMTVAAIYYRRLGGGFTLNRAEADCR